MNIFHKIGSGSTLFNQLKLTFNYLMIVVYVCFGLYFINYGWFSISKGQSTGIGILLIVYALFRTYRVIHESRMKKVENE